MVFEIRTNPNPTTLSSARIRCGAYSTCSDAGCFKMPALSGGFPCDVAISEEDGWMVRNLFDFDMTDDEGNRIANVIRPCNHSFF